MDKTNLRELIDSLPRGGKLELAIRLNVDQAKITKAKHGLVRDEAFLDRLKSECKSILAKQTALTKRLAKLKDNYPKAGVLHS